MISRWVFAAYNADFDVDASVSKIEGGKYRLTWDLRRHAPTGLLERDSNVFDSLASAIAYFRSLAAQALSTCPLFDKSKIEFRAL
jgi:hypothetical protein